MKNKLLIIISLLFINMGVAYADNKLLDYFHEEDIEILLNSNLKSRSNTFSSLSIPSHIAQHYLDFSRNFNEDHYSPAKNKKYSSHAKIKMDGFWILLYSISNNNINNVFIATYDEEKDDVISRLHIARYINSYNVDLDFSFFFGENPPEITVTTEFSRSVESEPTLLHETYRLDKTLTLIEYDEISWPNNCLKYTKINAELEENGLDSMSEEEFLGLFKTYSKLSEIPFVFDGYFEDIPAGSNLIPNSAYLCYLFPCKNEYKNQSIIRYPLSYYAIGKIWTGKCWLLVYRVFNSIHYTDLYISSYSKGKHKPDATLLLHSYDYVECTLFDKCVQLKYKDKQWPLPRAAAKKEFRRLDANFTVMTPRRKKR